MKAINNRLRRLENRFVPRKSDESSVAALIRERRRIRFEGKAGSLRTSHGKTCGG
jgi:hypothetical protein